jgi:hypothetical protein
MIVLIGKRDWTSILSVRILSKGGKVSGVCAVERTLMDRHEDSPDRRFWTPYDHFKVEQEARAMRRAHVCAMTRQLWQGAAKHLSAAFAQARAQPKRAHRTRAGI